MEPTRPTQRIVVGVDGSPVADAALRWAVAEAAVRGAQVEAVYAWHYPVVGGAPFVPAIPIDPAELEAAGKSVLEEALERLGPHGGIDVATCLVEGHPALVLLDAAEGADLLVVGSRGRGGFAGLLLGSVGRECVHRARCPVVVIPPAAEG